MGRMLRVVISLAVMVGVAMAASGCNTLSGDTSAEQGSSQGGQTHSGH